MCASDKITRRLQRPDPAVDTYFAQRRDTFLTEFKDKYKRANRRYGGCVSAIDMIYDFINGVTHCELALTEPVMSTPKEDAEDRYVVYG